MHIIGSQAAASLHDVFGTPEAIYPFALPAHMKMYEGHPILKSFRNAN